MKTMYLKRLFKHLFVFQIISLHRALDVIFMILFPRIWIKRVSLYQREMSVYQKTFSSPIGRVVALLVSLLFSYLTVTPAFGQEPVGLVLRGEVISASTGVPVEGATVFVDKKSVLTDKAGHFNISVSRSQGIIVVKHIGFQEQSIRYNSLTNAIIIDLVVENNILDEAVVIGYGTTTRRLSTGSVTKIAGETLEKQPISNPILALQGLVPGLFVSSNSGINGSVLDIKIRGNNSLTQGSEPLILMDGSPIAVDGQQISIVSNATSGISILNQLNPNDIESIEILKDADATAIYGSRGANGVILITSKSGYNQDTRLDVSMSKGVSNPNTTLAFLNTSEYFEMRKEGLKNSGLAINEINAPDLFYWKEGDYTDFSKYLQRTSKNNKTLNLNILGGNQRTRFRIGASHFGESYQLKSLKGVTRNTFNLDVSNRAFKDRVNIRFVGNYSSNFNEMTVYDPSSFLYLAPHAVLYNTDGSLAWQLGPMSFNSIGVINPHAQLENTYKGKFQTLFSNFSLDVELLPRLILKLSTGYTKITGDEYAMYPSTATDPSLSINPSSRWGTSNGASWIVEPQLNYNFVIGNSKFSYLFGASIQQRDDKMIHLSGMNYADDIFLKDIASAGYLLPNYSETKYKYAAAFGRFGYQLLDRYLVNISLRRDGSSRFGINRQYANFYSLGTGWIFSEDASVKKILSFLSYGKLRASYGITGNDQIGNYKQLDIWTTGSERYAGALPTNPTSLYNPNYSWEKNSKSEVAIELGFLQDRILFTSAFYKNISDNQLIQYILPSQTGFSAINKNLDARVLNQGIEMSIDGALIRNTNFDWTIKLGLTSNKNKLLRFPDLENSPYANQWELGYPLSIRRLYKYLGVNEENGIYEFEDVNQDKLLNEKDRIFFQDLDPKFYGGFTNNIRYKSWNLGLMFDFVNQKGNSFLSYINAVPGYGIVNHPRLVLNRWREPGDKSDIQRFASSVSDPAYTAMRNFNNSDGSITNATFLRLKNIHLSYLLKESLKNKWYKLIEVYLTAQNLKTWTNYVGGDPEIQSIYTTPVMQTIVVGTKLSF